MAAEGGRERQQEAAPPPQLGRGGEWPRGEGGGFIICLNLNNWMVLEHLHCYYGGGGWNAVVLSSPSQIQTILWNNILLKS